MPNELNNKQCDALQRETKIYVGCYGTGGMWEACDIMNVNKAVNEQPSRQTAITAYWQQYHKDWTPPAEDAVEETAMEILKEIVTADAVDLHLAVRNGYDFLKKVKEADHVD